MARLQPIPPVRVRAGGSALPAGTRARLIKVVVDLDVELFGECRLLFNDPDLALIDGAQFRSGTLIEVEAGLGEAQARIFAGEVVALEPRFVRDEPPSLLVVCHELLHRLALSQMTRTWNDADTKEIVTRIARENGLSADGPAGSREHLLQGNVTDALFLRRAALQMGQHLRIEGRKLVIAPPARTGELKIGPGDGLRKLRVQIRAGQQVSEVTVHGWDAKAKREIVARASGEGEAGEGSRAHGRGTLSLAGNESLPSDTATAEQMAKGRMRKLAEGFVVAHGEMRGDARVAPGRLLGFESMGPGIDGTYRVEHARHQLSRHGYHVAFKAVRVAKPKPPRPASSPAAAPETTKAEERGKLTEPRWTRERHEHGDEALMSVRAEGLDSRAVEFAVERHAGGAQWKLLGKVRGTVARGVAQASFPLQHEEAPEKEAPLDAPRWSKERYVPGETAEMEVRAPDGTVVRFVVENSGDAGWEKIADVTATAGNGVARAAIATQPGWKGPLRFTADAGESNHLRFRARLLPEGEHA